MSAQNMDRDEALSFLEANGDLAVPCSRYGRSTSDCAPVAWRLAEIMAEVNGDPIDEGGLDYLMGLVVNDHDDVAYLLRRYGNDEERERWAYVSTAQDAAEREE